MTTTQNLEDLMSAAGKMIDEGLETDKIRHRLAGSGADENTIETIIHQLKAQIYLRRRKRGFLFGLAGTILLVVGFLLTVLFYHSGISIHYVMYGMTSVGVILVLVGMIDVLGW
jgi:hypothetical protein